MATWSSNPSVPHTGGTFDFPENTGEEDIVYTITYEDGGCSASTTYTVSGATPPPPPTCLSSFTLTQIEKDVCEATYSAQTKNCEGKIISTRPTLSYDQNKVKVTSNPVSEGMIIVGWRYDLSTNGNPGERVKDQNVTFTSPIGEVSSSITFGDCCKPLSPAPIAQPTLYNDKTKNYVQVRVAIKPNGSTPSIAPTRGTVQFKYIIVWGPCTEGGTPFETEGTFNGAYDYTITINREECTGAGHPYRDVLSFTTSNINGNLGAMDCVDYIYRNANEVYDNEIPNK